MVRFGLLLVLALLVASGVWLAPSNSRLKADDAPIGAGGVPATLDLKGQLEKGLRARRPVEFAYIAEIIQMIDDDELPRSLVETTFVWARKKPSRQLQYFQFALRARASQMGIATPDLANQAVGNGH